MYAAQTEKKKHGNMTHSDAKLENTLNMKCVVQSEHETH